MSRRADAFTLIEVLAVVALTAVVMGVALSFYVDLSRASSRASEHTHDIRRATAILDRVARDFESAFLIVKPPEVDPIAHPWLFVAESLQGELGADHIKFVTRNHDPTRTGHAQSDLALVAFTVEADADGLLSLFRWSYPQLPESLDRTFPSSDDAGTFLLADGLADFGVRMITLTDETDSWDSTTLLESGSLPEGVVIELSLPPDDPEGEPHIFQRRVRIPVRPLDLVALVEGAADAAQPGSEEDQDGEDGEDGDGDGNSDGSSGEQASGPLTVSRCIIPSAGNPGAQCTGMITGLMSLQPNMPFTPQDAAAIPPDCQQMIAPQCR